MLKELVLKLELAYQKANLNTVIGSGVESLARTAQVAFAMVGNVPGEPAHYSCPALYASTVVEKRKEKYGRRILDICRELGKEQEGKDYLREHFSVYYDDIIDGKTIPKV